MPVVWEDVLWRLCPEISQRLLQMGMESIEDLRFFFTSFEDIQAKFPGDFEYTDEDHEEVFNLWRLVRAGPDSRLSGDQISALARRRARAAPRHPAAGCCGTGPPACSGHAVMAPGKMQGRRCDW